MRKLILLLLAVSATTAHSQVLTHRDTDFYFASMTRSETIAADIGRLRPAAKGDVAKERESAPPSNKFVVVRFALNYAPSMNARRDDAVLVGTVPEKAEPQLFKCHSTYTWVPENGTWSAAFVFVVPDDASLLSFRLGKDRTLDVSTLEAAAAMAKQ